MVFVALGLMGLVRGVGRKEKEKKGYEVEFDFEMDPPCN